MATPGAIATSRRLKKRHGSRKLELRQVRECRLQLRLAGRLLTHIVAQENNQVIHRLHHVETVESLLGDVLLAGLP